MDLGPQFDARIAAANAIPVEERRLRSFTERKRAAKQDANHWAIHVDHSSHDDLQQGVLARSHSRVVLSREAFPDAAEAEQTAYLMGRARGTYPTKVEHA